MRQALDLGQQRLGGLLVHAHQGDGVVARVDAAQVEGGDVDARLAQQAAQRADEARLLKF